MTSIWEPKWTKRALKSRDEAITKVSSLFDVREVVRWEYRDNMLDAYPMNELQELSTKPYYSSYVREILDEIAGEPVLEVEVPA